MSQGYRQGYRLADLENVLSERGISQADLARRSGLSAPTVRRAATGREAVSPTSANKIAGALSMRVRSLCNDRRQSGTDESKPRADGAEDHPDFDPRKMREVMAKKGMNPTEIANRTELSVATVSSALRGLREPRKDTIAKIAAAVGKVPEELCRKLVNSDDASPDRLVQASGMELRLVAGQARTALYPVKISTENETSTPAQTPVQEEVVESTTTGKEDTNDTLGSLLWRLQQTRHMVTSLMDHIGDLEAQVGQALASQGASGQTSTNAQSRGI